MKCITSLVLLLVASVGMAQGVPNTFTAGTPARAAEVNANFTDLDTRLTAGEQIVSQLFAEIDFLYLEATAPAVSSVLCPTDTIAISAQCLCDGDGTTINFGVLFGCVVAPDGAVAGCFPEALTADFGIADPTAIVTAVCVSAILVDGTVATVAATGNPASKSAMQKISMSEETTEQIAVRFQNKALAQRNAAQLRQ